MEKPYITKCKSNLKRYSIGINNNPKSVYF